MLKSRLLFKAVISNDQEKNMPIIYKLQKFKRWSITQLI